MSVIHVSCWMDSLCPRCSHMMNILIIAKMLKLRNGAVYILMKQCQNIIIALFSSMIPAPCFPDLLSPYCEVQPIKYSFFSLLLILKSNIFLLCLFRALKALWHFLGSKGINTNLIWEKIKDIVIKTIIA